MFDDKYNDFTLDEVAEKSGGYVDYVPGRPIIIDYDYRALSDYCRAKGIKPTRLSEHNTNEYNSINGYCDVCKKMKLIAASVGAMSLAMVAVFVWQSEKLEKYLR